MRPASTRGRLAMAAHGVRCWLRILGWWEFIRHVNNVAAVCTACDAHPLEPLPVVRNSRKHCRLQVREQGTASVAGSRPSSHALCAVLPDVPPPTSAMPTVFRHSPLAAAGDRSDHHYSGAYGGYGYGYGYAGVGGGAWHSSYESWPRSDSQQAAHADRTCCGLQRSKASRLASSNLARSAAAARSGWSRG